MAEKKTKTAAKKTTAKKTTTKKAAPKTATKKAPAKKTAEKAPKAKAATAKQVDLEKLSKQDIIETFATKDGDTGSPEVQIALSSQKIVNLTSHLNQNPKDNHSRRGLLKIIAKRRRILHYLQDKDESRYASLIKMLGLKK